MFIVNTLTQQIFTEREFRAAHPGTSFPAIIGPALAATDFAVAQDWRNIPVPDGMKVTGMNALFEDGVWKVVNTIEDMTQSEQDAQRRSAILSQLQILDVRRIRPMAEGDTDFLNELNAQAEALRAELQNIMEV